MEFFKQYEQCCETGEFWPRYRFNQETGEKEVLYSTAPPKRAFKIPGNIDGANVKVDGNVKRSKTSPHRYSDNIDVVTAFLIPTTILFMPGLAVLMWLFEYILHSWSHKQNSKNEDNYYFSPLHQICKEFCGKCRDESMKKKMIRIQDVRKNQLKHELEYVRRIVT